MGEENSAARVGVVSLASKQTVWAKLPGVAKVIAVASAKGGVGKSSVAVNLALALRDKGHKVGLMDADVYGPSLPHLLGVDERPQAIENRLQPIIKDDIRLMSMGFLSILFHIILLMMLCCIIMK